MGKVSFGEFVWMQLTRLDPVLAVDLAGKSVVVLGANTGIGLETAKHFARMRPARLILACRNEQKGADAARLIAQETNYTAEFQLLDLSSFESVIAFGKRLENDPIDILVANAAVSLPDWRVTKDGWEETVQVNHLSTSLVCLLLLPNLAKAAQLHASASRVVIVGSGVHFWTKLEDDAIYSEHGLLAAMSDRNYPSPAPMTKYFQSKLLNVLFTRAFAHHLSDANAIIPAVVDPGLCGTDLGRNYSLTQRVLGRIVGFFLGWTPEEGARQLVYAALGPDGNDGPHVRTYMSGAYLSVRKVMEPSDFVISKKGWEVQEQLWRETIDILTKVAPSVRGIVDKYCSS